jgi:hypothetical protein
MRLVHWILLVLLLVKNQRELRAAVGKNDEGARTV